MADTTQGDADAAGLTAPGELHLNITGPTGQPATAGGLFSGDDGALPWWLLVVAGVAVLVILKR